MLTPHILATKKLQKTAEAVAATAFGVAGEHTTVKEDGDAEGQLLKHIGWRADPAEVPRAPEPPDDFAPRLFAYMSGQQQFLPVLRRRFHERLAI